MITLIGFLYHDAYAVSGVNGKIVFQSNRYGIAGIYSMFPDWSVQTRLTANDVNSFWDGNPNNNFGWTIKKLDETNSGMVGFASKENADSIHTPQLVLTLK